MTDAVTAASAASAVTKLGISWGGFGVAGFLNSVGLHSWGDFAGMMSGFLTSLMVIDFLWKKWKARKHERRPRK